MWQGPASAGDARDSGLIPGSGRFPGVRNGNLLQYSCLENAMDRESWPATHSPWGCTESDTTDHRTAHTILRPVGKRFSQLTVPEAVPD